MTPDHEPDHFAPKPDDDVRRWFRALPPPPQGQVPPYWRANVLARIDQRRARRAAWTWWLPRQPPAWVTVAAIVLLCSLSVNIWWAVHTLGQRQPEAQRTLDVPPAYRFQQGIQNVQALGAFAARRPALQEPSLGLAFAPQEVSLTAFRLGTVYADAVATLRSGAWETARQQVDSLIYLLENLQAPALLAEHLRHVQTLMHSQRYAGELLAKLLALFEPLYAMEYAHTQDPQVLAFFQAGAWLETILLAAQAGDAVVLKQAPAVQHIRTAFTRLKVPPEVLSELEALRQLMTGQELTADQSREIQRLTKNLQRTLGAIPG